VERVDLRDTHMREDHALVSPVNLSLSTRNHLEPAVQTREFTRANAQLVRDTGPCLLQVELHALVGASEPTLLDQAFVDHRPLDQDLRPQHRIDQRCNLVHHPPTRLAVRSPLRRRDRHLPRQVLADRPPVQPSLFRDLRQTHRPRLVQTAKPPQFQPAMRVQDHRQPPSAIPNRQQQTADQQPSGHQELSTFIRSRLCTFTCTPTPPDRVKLLNLNS
jgi:hypothetical protein